MGAIKGTISFTRFFVQGELPEHCQDVFVDAIRAKTFLPLVAEEEDIEHMGWCSIAHPFDLDLDHTKVYQNSFLNLGIRIDQWKIPAPLFKAHFAELAQAKLAERGREKLSRREKDELKQILTKRLRKQIIPTMKVIDLSWDLNSGIVRLWNNSAKFHERFQELFEDTFHLKLWPESPYTTALRAGLSEPQVETFDQLKPTVFHAQCH